MYFDIESSINWDFVKPISKGWSRDKKYLVKTKDGEELLLRLSDIVQYDVKKKEYEIIQKYSELDIKMSLPVEFGICNRGENVYMLLTWVEGKDLEEVLPTLSEKEQYLLGRQAGAILKKIHSISIDEKDISDNDKKAKKLAQLSRYERSDVRISGDDFAVQYVKDNIDQIRKEKSVYLHGDFHPGNLIYMDDGHIGVIDFNRWEVGDPYEEFYKLDSFGTELSISYCIGQIDSYFNDEIPVSFWKTHSVYVAHASLFSIAWAEKFGQEDVNRMIKRCKAALENYDGFRICVPKWYTDKYRKLYKIKKDISYVVLVFVLIIACLFFLPSMLFAVISPETYALDITDENRDYIVLLAENTAGDRDDVPDMTSIYEIEYTALMHKYEISVSFDDGSQFTFYNRDKNTLIKYIQNNGYDQYLFSAESLISKFVAVIDVSVIVGCSIGIVKLRRLQVTKKEDEDVI